MWKDKTMDEESIRDTILACMDYDMENDTWYMKASEIDSMVQDLVKVVDDYHANKHPCDCDRQPLRFNEFGVCKYCGKKKL